MFMNFALLSQNLQFLFICVVRLVIASILGIWIGLEREQYNRPAGSRTYALVCIGSALIMLISEFLSMKYGNSVDITRLGAQVISGIGFLGAGTIMKEGFTVRGLTTAAGLWVMACIGLAIGVGFYAGAIIAAILNYLILLIFKNFIKNYSNKKAIHLLINDVEKTYPKVIEEIEFNECNIISTEILSIRGNLSEIRLLVGMTNYRKQHDFIIQKIGAIDGVEDFHEE